VKIDTLLVAAGPVLHRASLSTAQQRTLTSAHAVGRVVRLLAGWSMTGLSVGLPHHGQWLP